MAQRIPRYGIAACAALWMMFGCGCPSVPQREFKAYRDAFAETATLTEQFLVEYTTLKRAETQAQPVKAKSPAPKPPYVAQVDLIRLVNDTSSKTPVAARYDALRAVTGFNSVLVSLAEGKKPEEVRSATDSLIGNLTGLATQVGRDFDIPYAGQVGALIATVVTKLDEARNRQQFCDALRAGEPVIRGILDRFILDAQDVYEMRARQSDRLWTRHQDNVAMLLRQVKAVCKPRGEPAGEQASRLKGIEGRVRQVYDRVGLENSEKMETTGNGTFDELVFCQFEQLLSQANAEAEKYETVVRAQVAFYELTVSYAQLLSRTKSALATLRGALDNPVDMRQEAHDLLSFALEVRRDWEALEKARRSTGGS